MIQNIRDCDVEGDPASEIFYQFQECQTLNGTAKTVVFNVGRKHEDAYDMVSSLYIAWQGKQLKGLVSSIKLKK